MFFSYHLAVEIIQIQAVDDFFNKGVTFEWKTFYEPVDGKVYLAICRAGTVFDFTQPIDLNACSCTSERDPSTNTIEEFEYACRDLLSGGQQFVLHAGADVDGQFGQLHTTSALFSVPSNLIFFCFYFMLPYQ